jgi:hypothetical protein
MRDWEHAPNGPALGAPEKSPTVGQFSHEVCRRPVTRRAPLGDGRRFGVHDDIAPSSEKRPARPRGEPGRPGDEQRRRHRDRCGAHDIPRQQIECRAHRRVAASRVRNVRCDESSVAESYVAERGDGVGWTDVRPLTGPSTEPAVCPSVWPRPHIEGRSNVRAQPLRATTRIQVLVGDITSWALCKRLRISGICIEANGTGRGPFYPQRRDESDPQSAEIFPAWNGWGGFDK